MSLKNLMVGLVVVVFAMACVKTMAEEKAVEAGIKKVMPAKEITLTGKLILKEDIKGEVKATDKVESDKEVVKVKEEATLVCKYALVQADGSEVALPEPKAKPGEKAIDLAALVGKNVKVVALGSERMKEGKKVIKVMKIVSVTEETAAPAAAPAAEKPAEKPAETPAAK
jgi:hypothetical protein